MTATMRLASEMAGAVSLPLGFLLETFRLAPLRAPTPATAFFVFALSGTPSSVGFPLLTL
ncbi:hypothetical protein [Methylobacterium sp. CM6247]